ncbi:MULTISPECIES: bifunctional adenosylcobinamide kinase/adenosylcobinamide-phosphate guanylyltransferase [Aphanothece]|uniref:bifunctional adenosylcobinamide kinase/adenosylcobinamide-phosphate guanylyltransferase n=1 Tax=Aphanothece stagnina TaxID=1004305 RepID=UPI00398511EF
MAELQTPPGPARSAAVPPRLQLVTGPARSGKSRWAEHLASAHTGPVSYVATGPALPNDPAWQERVQAHRRRRPPHWRTLELQAELARVLQELAGGELALVDSLGTWVAWGLDQDRGAWQARCDALEAALLASPGRVILVAEQTGWGVVPATAVGGLFRDRLGALEQQLAARCDTTWLVVAGRALDLSGLGLPVPR